MPEQAHFDPTEWHTYRVTQTVNARRLTQSAEVESIDGTLEHGGPGDYLVEYPGGGRRILKQAYFEGIYSFEE